MSLLGFSASSPVSTLLPALAWCTACSWPPFSPGRWKHRRPEVCEQRKTTKREGEPKPSLYLVQLGELDSLLRRAAPSDGGDVQHPIAKLNEGSSVCGQEHEVTGGIYRGWERKKKRLFQGNGCSVRHAVSAGTRRRRGAMPPNGCSCFRCARASKVAQEPCFSRQRPGVNNY